MRTMAGRLKAGLMTYALALGLALSPAAAEEFQIRDGYIPLANCLKSKPGISHYFLRGERAGMLGDNFYNIMIEAERIGTPGLGISGLEPDAPYKIFVTECKEDGDCNEADGFLLMHAKARK